MPTQPVPLLTRSELLHALVDVTGQVAALEARTLDESGEHDGPVAVELSSKLSSAIELLDALRGLDEHPRTDSDDGDTENWWQEQSGILAPPRVGDICFAGGFELRRAHRQLLDARDADEVAVAAESAHRKLARGVRAVLSAARDNAVALDFVVLPEDDFDDLTAAIAVRRVYQRFRRALRTPRDESPEAVLEALRYAAGALAALMSDPVYTEVRASDRALLRRLHQRILTWARHNRPASIGLQLLADVRTCSDLLRDISRRQELRAHDSTLCRALSLGPRSDPASFDASLENLLGMDDRLDEAIETWRAAPSASTLRPLLDLLGELEPR